jgi:hypothetical protein
VANRIKQNAIIIHVTIILDIKKNEEEECIIVERIALILWQTE